MGVERLAAQEERSRRGFIIMTWHYDLLHSTLSKGQRRPEFTDKELLGRSRVKALPSAPPAFGIVYQPDTLQIALGLM